MKQPRLVAFDLDGTLAESKQALSAEMAALLAQLLQKIPVAVMSGGSWAQLQSQFLAVFPSGVDFSKLYLFPTNTSQCYVYKNSVWQQLYGDQLTDVEKESILKALHEALAESGFQQPPQLWGEQTQDRGTQISFSALGQHAPLPMKKEWRAMHDDERMHLRDILGAKLTDFSVKTGGETTIDITKKGVTKAYGVKQLAQITSIPISDMLYVGDALGKDGNDSTVIETGVRTHEVRGPADSAAFIKTILQPTMNTQKWLIIAVLFIVIAAGLVALVLVPQNVANTPQTSGIPSASTTPAYVAPAAIIDTITVTTPLPNAKIASPFTITGTARGNWYFEASAPVELRDASGTVIAQGHITAQGDWMTTDFVPFTATLTFTAQPSGRAGTLVLRNDNPSGDPSREKKLEIPVVF